MTDYIEGTNIPRNKWKGTDEELEDVERRIAEDIAQGDWDGANDALFTAAYGTVEGGQGQGNVNVGKVQRNIYKIDNSPTSWAESSIDSENDEYIIANDEGGTSKIEFSDSGCVIKDNKTTGSWGGQGKGENQPHSEDVRVGNLPNVGISMTVDVPKDVSGAWMLTEGVHEDRPINEPGPSRGGDTGWNVGGPGGPAGETSLLAYRPGSEAYWKSYMGPKMTGSLMRMKQPAATQASLGYLPGEVRDLRNWNNWVGAGGILKDASGNVVWENKPRDYSRQFQGAIPQGTWRTGLAQYPGLGQAGIRQPGWQFAAAPSGMINQPAWTASDITPSAAAEWTGLLGDWAAPKLNTTNLLGVA